MVMVAALVLHGCATTYSVVEFEVLEPATINFPPDVQRLILLDRAPVTLDAFDPKDRAGMTREHLEIIDTIISNALMEGIKEILGDFPYKQFSDPIMLKELRTDTAGLKDLILTKREVADMCAEYDGDAVISLEYYSLDLNEHRENYPGYSDDTFYETLYAHYYIISNETRWIIYLPGSPAPFDTYRMKDTLYFTDYIEGEFKPIPDVPGMIRETFKYSGEKYGRYLVPVWSRASRILFRGRDAALKEAGKYTDQGAWDEAFAIWKGLTGSEDSSLVSKAYHNMAVYYELEDKLDSADLLAGMAVRFDTLEIFQNYKEELDTRIENKREIQKQLE